MPGNYPNTGAEAPIDAYAPGSVAGERGRPRIELVELEGPRVVGLAGVVQEVICLLVVEHRPPALGAGAPIGALTPGQWPANAAARA